MALLIVTVCAVMPISHAAAAPIPGTWCGPDESPRDRPDLVAGPQIHVVYAYPTDSSDRFGDMAPSIARDLAGVDTWWRSQDPLRTPRFDLASFPGCDTEFGALDLTSLPLTFDSSLYDPQGRSEFASRVGDDLIANGMADNTKKYLVFYDGPAGGGVCGRSASSSVSGGPRRVSFVYLQADPGCRVGGYGSGNGWPARTVAHELLHALNDPFVPGTAPNVCEDGGHVCDSTSDVLSTGTIHPSPRLSDAVLDVAHDDYYDHNGTWWDIRDSSWLMHLDTPPGLLTIALSGAGGGEVATAPYGNVCADTCTTRYDGDTALRLTAVEHPGFRLLMWGGACSGTSRSCDATVTSGGMSVIATFGPAVTVVARTRGPGRIAQLEGAPCAGECALDLIPGARAVIGAQPDVGARFVGWRGLCGGTQPACVVAVSLGAEHPTSPRCSAPVRRPAFPPGETIRRPCPSVLLP